MSSTSTELEVTMKTIIYLLKKWCIIPSLTRDIKGKMKKADEDLKSSAIGVTTKLTTSFVYYC